MDLSDILSFLGIAITAVTGFWGIRQEKVPLLILSVVVGGILTFYVGFKVGSYQGKQATEEAVASLRSQLMDRDEVISRLGRGSSASEGTPELAEQGSNDNGAHSAGESTSPTPREVLISKVDEDNRFIVWSNETIEDKGRRIIWPLTSATDTVDWKTARAICENYGLGTMDDWALPSPEEMRDLLSTHNSANGRGLVSFMNLDSLLGRDYWTNVSMGSKATRVDRRGAEAGFQSERARAVCVHRAG